MAGEITNILVVDDVPTNIHLLEEMLERDDYRVATALNGPTALTMAKAAPPDLILLDIMMPGMDGYQVCRELKADPATADVPVIFITVKDDEIDEERGFAVGGVDYITKPFSIPIVRARVRTHIALKKHRDFIEQLLAKRTLEFEQSEQEYMKLYLRKLH